MLLRAINREKFPRGLNKPRTINSMKDSILPATAAHAIDFGYIEGALRRSEAMRSSEVDPVEPPTVGELEEALGEAVEKFTVWFAGSSPLASNVPPPERLIVPAAVAVRLGAISLP